MFTNGSSSSSDKSDLAIKTGVGMVGSSIVNLLGGMHWQMFQQLKAFPMGGKPGEYIWLLRDIMCEKGFTDAQLGCETSSTTEAIAKLDKISNVADRANDCLLAAGIANTIAGMIFCGYAYARLQRLVRLKADNAASGFEDQVARLQQDFCVIQQKLASLQQRWNSVEHPETVHLLRLLSDSSMFRESVRAFKQEVKFVLDDVQTRIGVVREERKASELKRAVAGTLAVSGTILTVVSILTPASGLFYAAAIGANVAGVGTTSAAMVFEVHNISLCDEILADLQTVESSLKSLLDEADKLCAAADVFQKSAQESFGQNGRR